MKISVILPVYNEEESLKEILPKIFSAVGNDAEIIVINDGSTDNSAAVACQYKARVINNPYNMGNGAAVKRGIRQATGDVIILMDADGQHQPKDISKLLKELGDFDMVIGSRVNSAQLWYRKFANDIYNFLASYVSGAKIDDLTSGFRAFKRNKAIKFLYLLPNTFSYPSTLTLAFIKAAYPVKFIPIDVLPRQKGKSKINLLSDGSRFFIIIMRICVFFAPLKIFLPVSLSFFISGFFYYLYTFFTQHRFTNMSALLITTSVIIFLLGLVSEQIASLKMEKSDSDN